MFNIILIIFFIFFTKISHANNFTPFMKLFSKLCVTQIHDFEGIKEYAKLQDWKLLNDKQKTIMGRPASGAPFDGWSFNKKGVQGVFILGLVNSKVDKMKTCTLYHTKSKYKVNRQLLETEFNIKKTEEYKQGIQYMEIFKVKHFMFDKAYAITQQNKSSKEFDLHSFTFGVDLK